LQVLVFFGRGENFLTKWYIYLSRRKTDFSERALRVKLSTFWYTFSTLVRKRMHL